jgi:hypothetical protein
MPVQRTTREPLSQSPATGETMSYLLKVGRRLVEFEVHNSPTPLDPASWPGWTVNQVCTGWQAVRVR